MEDNGKKVIQISLSKFIILMVLLIIIMGLGIGLYVNSLLRNPNKEPEIQAFNEKENIVNEVANNENVVDNEQVNNNKEVVSTTSDEKNTEKNKNTEFSNEEVKECLQNYLDLVGVKAGSPSGLLVKLNLLNNEDSVKNKGSATKDGYIKTNIPYSKYKSEMMNYVTEEWFNKKFTDYFKNQNDLLYYFDGGATGMQFEVKSVGLKGIYSDSSYIAQVDNIAMDDSITTDNVEVHVENYNGRCVVSYCDY